MATQSVKNVLNRKKTFDTKHKNVSPFKRTQDFLKTAALFLIYVTSEKKDRRKKEITLSFWWVAPATF